MPEDNNKEPMIDLPSGGPDTEVTLPEDTIKEGAQDVAVPETKPEGEVEVVEEKKEEAPKELIQEDKQETTTEEKPKQESELDEYSDGVKKRIAKRKSRRKKSFNDLYHLGIIF